MPKHRGANEGTIVKRRDGRWVAAISLGGRRRKWFYGTTREEVQRKMIAALHALNTGGLADSRSLTVSDFLNQWLHEVVRPSVRVWTYRGYEVHVRLHINPVLGFMPLDRVEPRHVQSLLNQKLKEGMAPKSVRYIRARFATHSTRPSNGVWWPGTPPLLSMGRESLPTRSKHSLRPKRAGSYRLPRAIVSKRSIRWHSRWVWDSESTSGSNWRSGIVSQQPA
jgi:hypothetical protein